MILKIINTTTNFFDCYLMKHEILTATFCMYSYSLESIEFKFLSIFAPTFAKYLHNSLRKSTDLVFNILSLTSLVGGIFDAHFLFL